jgi:carbamoyl-phosphate synthase large subunit
VDYNVPLVLNGRLGKELTQGFLNSRLTYYEMRDYGGGI